MAPVLFQEPTSLVIGRLDGVKSAEVTAINIGLSTGRTVVTISSEVVVVTRPQQTVAATAGDPSATPPTPATPETVLPEVTERQPLPNVELEGDELAAYITAVTAWTLKTGDLRAAIKQSSYDYLKKIGRLPSDAKVA